MTPSSSAPEPSVPDGVTADGWECVERRSGVRFELPTMRVSDHTLVYEDEALAEAAPATTKAGDPVSWRFFFATALSFEPPLPPVTGTATTLPTVLREGRKAFEDELAERGVEDVERRRSERTRTRDRNRLTLTPYRGRLEVSVDDADDPCQVPVAGYLGVWVADGAFRMAGGGYPERSLASALPSGPETDPHAFRDELLSLIRGTG